MKKTKVLSLLLAGSLLFHSAGIEVLATSVSDPVPEAQLVDTLDGAASGDETDGEASEQTTETEEGQNPEQSSEPESEEEKTEDSSGTVEVPEEPSDSGEETGDPSGETEEPDISSDEENKEPAEDLDEDEVPADESLDLEDTISENTISENALPEEELEKEDSEEDAFAIFPGLGDSYTLSSEQMADKRELSIHVGDIVSTYGKNAEDYPDADGLYELGEVVYLAETEAEAEQVAEAFGGNIDSYSYGVAVISLPKSATVAMAVAAAADPAVKLPAVWPNYYNYLYNDMNEMKAVAAPSDPGFAEQWQHDYIGTRYAWAAGYKGQKVKVAVIDSGLQTNHEDLAANAIEGKNFVGGAAGTAYNTDNGSHGTHVAGIIAADDNGKGGVGIAPDAQVRGYCVFPAGDDSSADSADIMRAINAAVEDGNHIINMSLGGPMYSGDYEKTVKAAYNKGVAIFAASGNEDTNSYAFPAAYSGAISVGAVDQNGAKASFSNYGSTVKLAFPGMHIYSTIPTNSYGYMNGTSQASPAAAGTAAVILSANESIRNKTGKARVDALLSAMKSSTTKSSSSGMGAGTTWLPGVLKIASDMTAPDAPVIAINETAKTGTTYEAESVTATLSTQTAVDVEIWYTIDGKNPTYKNGEVINGNKYTAPITLTGAKKVTIKAIALNPITGKVSKVASKSCTLAPIPTGVTLDSKTGISRVAPGKSLALTASVTPAYAVSTKVQWSVGAAEKEAGITVSNGTVKTKGTTPVGTYTVTATAVGADGKTFNGVSSKPYKFEVISGSIIKTIAFKDEGKSLKAQTLDIGKTLELISYLNVTTQDGSAHGANDVIWSSSNSKVATVKDGVVTAVAPGKAVIKAISNDGFNKSASCNVTVNQPVTRITLSGPQKVAVGKAITLKATVTPANATNQKLTWKVEGNDKVTVANGKVTAKSGATGTCTVTATAVDGSNISSAAYPITIVSGKITKITLSNTNMVLFSKKVNTKTPITEKLVSTVDGETGADTTLIEWTSSAPSIVSVDKNGNITAKAPGKATITCAATDGSNKKAACTVKVNVPMSKLSIGTTDSFGNFYNDEGIYAGYVAQGKSVKMSAKCGTNYGTPTNKKVTWKSSNPEVATVDKNGKVTAVKTAAIGSEAVITATAEDGSEVVSNEYTVMVSPLFKYFIFDGYEVVGITADGAGYLPSYYTVSVSGGKNPGLNKMTVPEKRADGTTIWHYLLYPIPGKVTTTKPYSSPTLYTSDLQKMTVTVKLRDGSGLKAKKTVWAARFDGGKVGYYD
ncbi:MAG: S8 family serine peptidase [Lachnospiraceae bacterium]|nr:S8 family serine peptidase [Lachnospiraceae bacterium]